MTSLPQNLFHKNLYNRFNLQICLNNFIFFEMISKKQNILKSKAKRNFKINKNTIINNSKPVIYTKPKGKHRVKSRDIKEFEQKENTNNDDPDNDEQNLPRGLRNILKNSQLYKNDPKSFKFNKMKPDEERAKKKVVEVPKMLPHKNESENRFLWRIREESKTAIEKSQLQNQFHTKLTLPGEEGIKIKKSKSAKKSLRRLKEKNQKKSQLKLIKKFEDVETLTDVVKFGDVVKGPPVFKSKFVIKPKKSIFQEVSK